MTAPLALLCAAVVLLVHPAAHALPLDSTEGPTVFDLLPGTEPPTSTLTALVTIDESPGVTSTERPRGSNEEGVTDASFDALVEMLRLTTLMPEERNSSAPEETTIATPGPDQGGAVVVTVIPDEKVAVTVQDTTLVEETSTVAFPMTTLLEAVPSSSSAQASHLRPHGRAFGDDASSATPSAATPTATPIAEQEQHTTSVDERREATLVGRTTPQPEVATNVPDTADKQPEETPLAHTTGAPWASSPTEAHPASVSSTPVAYSTEATSSTLSPPVLTTAARQAREDDCSGCTQEAETTTTPSSASPGSETQDKAGCVGGSCSGLGVFPASPEKSAVTGQPPVDTSSGTSTLGTSSETTAAPSSSASPAPTAEVHPCAEGGCEASPDPAVIRVDKAGGCVGEACPPVTSAKPSSEFSVNQPRGCEGGECPPEARAVMASAAPKPAEGVEKEDAASGRKVDCPQDVMEADMRFIVILVLLTALSILGVSIIVLVMKFRIKPAARRSLSMSICSCFRRTRRAEITPPLTEVERGLELRTSLAAKPLPAAPVTAAAAATEGTPLSSEGARLSSGGTHLASDDDCRAGESNNCTWAFAAADDTPEQKPAKQALNGGDIENSRM